MEAALIILASLLIVGIILRLTHHPDSAPDDSDDIAASDLTASGKEECCGMHITCQRDSLLAVVSDDIQYYDDEELDVYAGRPADGYTPAETEQFRDVLLTLLPDDIAGWARSIQLRGIALPEPVREELLMIVAEARAARLS